MGAWIWSQRKKAGSLFRRYREARYSGYKGTFEQYKQLIESYEPLEVEPPQPATANSLDEAIRMAAEKEKLEESNKTDDEKLLERRYDESLMAGYSGNFQQWKQRMMDAEAIVTAREEANKETEFFTNPTSGMWPHEILASEKLERELRRKAEIKQYESDIQNGLWRGSFKEWLDDQKEQQQKRARDFVYPS